MIVQSLTTGYSAGLAAALSPCTVLLIPLILLKFSSTPRPLPLPRRLLLFSGGFLATYLAFAYVIGWLLSSSLSSGVSSSMGFLFVTTGLLSAQNRLPPLDLPLLDSPPAIGAAFAALVTINPCTIPFLALTLSLNPSDAFPSLAAFGLGLLTPALAAAGSGPHLLALFKKWSPALHGLNTGMAYLLAASGGYFVYSTRLLSSRIEFLMLAAAALASAAIVHSAFAPPLSFAPPQTRAIVQAIFAGLGIWAFLYAALALLMSPGVPLFPHTQETHAALTLDPENGVKSGSCIDLNLLPPCPPCSFLRIASLLYLLGLLPAILSLHSFASSLQSHLDLEACLPPNHHHHEPDHID